MEVRVFSAAPENNHQVYAHLDTRARVRISLETASLDEACILRDRLAEADESYWAALRLADGTEAALGKDEVIAAQVRYKSARTRALAAGFSYRPLDALLP